MLPLTTNVKEAYRNGRDDEQNFIQNLSLFLSTFLRQHGQLIDKKVELHDVLLEVCLLCIVGFVTHNSDNCIQTAALRRSLKLPCVS